MRSSSQRTAAVLFSLIPVLALAACAGSGPSGEDAPDEGVPDDYLDYSGREDVLSGGARMIPIETPQGTFEVWTKRIGNRPSMKVLLLHGGPGMTHDYLEAFDSHLPAAGIEYYHYDQLGSGFSDQPGDPSLWSVDRYVSEVEQVRRALGLDRENFYLYGNSWGGLLAIEYALAHGEHLKGLIVSNMMASIPAYNAYADSVLKPAMDSAALAEIERLEAEGAYDDPRYMELLVEHHYEDHVLRMPADEWPEPVNRSFDRMNPELYVTMQGPSELGAGGRLADWDRTGDLSEIETPTLIIGAEYDTMDPEHMRWMANQVQNGRYLHCAEGSHLAMYDDPQTYFDGLVRFVKDVDAGRF